jgi:hypothetical protein
LEDEDKEVEVHNEEVQEKNDDALNGGDSGSDYAEGDDKEVVVAEQKDSSRELNDEINAQRFSIPGVAKLGSSNFRQHGSHQQ